MRNIHKKIETASNIAIIIVALLFGGVLINRYFVSASPTPTAVENKEIKAGTILPLSEIDWNKSNKNLVLVLSTNCHFCSESTPFYQKLAARQKAENSNSRLIAVMPQSVDEARHYLTESGISVDEIKQTSLNTINIQGTPTLVLVDQNGAVI